MLDAHLHLWDPALLTYPWLSGDLARRCGPESLPRREDAEYIFVQADAVPRETLAEIDWAASLDLPLRGIVARAAVEEGGDATARHLAAVTQRNLVVGVRRPILGDAPGFGSAPAFVDGLRAVASTGLVFDACVRADQLRHVSTMADVVPDLPIVLDHLGKPPTNGTGQSEWMSAFADVALRSSVVCKLSGLPSSLGSGWSADDAMPFLDIALTAFGPDRLLYGSDWPVSGESDHWLEVVEAWALDRLGDTSGVLGGNAARVYGITAGAA